MAMILLISAALGTATTAPVWAQIAVAAPFDDAEAQLRIRQAATAASTAAREVDDLRGALEAERKRAVLTNEERDLNRETIKALETKLRDSEARQRDRDAALKQAHEARRQGQAPAPVPPPTASMSPSPPLPADRWDRKDLSLLKGCWQLDGGGGTNLPSRAGTNEDCTAQANTICFGDNGRGERQLKASCPSTGTYVCTAPVVAAFIAGSNALGTSQPKVKCTDNFYWDDLTNYLVCRRSSDATAFCTDGAGEYQLRRGP